MFYVTLLQLVLGGLNVHTLRLSFKLYKRRQIYCQDSDSMLFQMTCPIQLMMELKLEPSTPGNLAFRQGGLGPHNLKGFCFYKKV